MLVPFGAVLFPLTDGRDTASATATEHSKCTWMGMVHRYVFTIPSLVILFLLFWSRQVTGSLMGSLTESYRSLEDVDDGRVKTRC